jgi:hypothetical protein
VAAIVRDLDAGGLTVAELRALLGLPADYGEE